MSLLWIQGIATSRDCHVVGERMANPKDTSKYKRVNPSRKRAPRVMADAAVPADVKPVKKKNPNRLMVDEASNGPPSPTCPPTPMTLCIPKCPPPLHTHTRTCTLEAVVLPMPPAPKSFHLLGSAPHR